MKTELEFLKSIENKISQKGIVSVVESDILNQTRERIKQIEVLGVPIDTVKKTDNGYEN